MRHKGAHFGHDADAREQLFDLAMERRERFVRLAPGPSHMRPALPLEQADPRDPGDDRPAVKRAARRRDLFRLMMVDLAARPPGAVQTSDERGYGKECFSKVR